MAASRNITTPAHDNTIADDQVSVSQNLSKMMSATADAAGEAMPKITRRGMMAAMAAMTAVTAPTVALAAPIITQPANLPIEAAENPALIAAYDRFLQASAEVTASKEALQWLADEWRHLWPLAPEELLDGANADRYSSRDTAERDIVGNYLKRDTSGLTIRFSRKQRERTPNTCFSVITHEKAREMIERWSGQTPKGRTAKALERNRATRDQFISEYQRKLVLARQYEAETARLRAEAGVEEVNRRISVAETAVLGARSDISNAPAYTAAGLRIKAEAVKTSGPGLLDIPHDKGFFGELSRFIDATLNLHSATA